MHLIDLVSGRVIEIRDREIERLQKQVARALGYRLTGSRLELHCEPITSVPLSPSACNWHSRIESTVGHLGIEVDDAI
jgi:hypothetical protein